MFKITALALCCLLSLSACSKTARGKWHYKHGNYKKAEELLTRAINVDTKNTEASKYLVLVQAGMKTDEAAAKLKEGDLETAVSMLNEAIGFDSGNEDAKILLNQAVEQMMTQIDKTLIPGGQWDKILGYCGLMEKYRAENGPLAVARARAMFEKAKRLHTYEVVLALEKAAKLAPDNAWVKGELETVRQNSVKFAALFNKYQQTLLKKDFASWKSLLQPKYLVDAEAIVKRYVEKEDESIKSLKDYFNEMSGDPVKYGSPEGGKIVCVEPLSPTHGFIHFIYKDYPKVLRMEAEGAEGRMKLFREDDSEIKKGQLE